GGVGGGGGGLVRPWIPPEAGRLPRVASEDEPPAGRASRGRRARARPRPTVPRVVLLLATPERHPPRAPEAPARRQRHDGPASPTSPRQIGRASGRGLRQSYAAICDVGCRVSSA